MRSIARTAAALVLLLASTFAAAQLTVTIDQAPAQADPANQAPVRFTVTFSAPVTGFEPNDVTLAAGTAPGPLAALVTGSGANYTVTIAGMTGSGTVVATIPAGRATDGVLTNQASTSTDNVVTYNHVAPGGPFAYVTNFTGGSVSVVSLSGLVTVATIPVCSGASGIAVNPAGTRAYVGCGTNSVRVVDLTTNTATTSIPVIGANNGLVMNAAGTRVYADGGSFPGIASVIDTASDTVITTVIVGNIPLKPAISESTNRLYVPNRSSTDVSVIDLVTNTLLTTITGFGTSVFGVSTNPAGTRAYVAVDGGDRMDIIDTATNTVIGTIPLGAGSGPFDAIVSPSGTTLYTANHGLVEGISVIDTATNAILTTIPLNANANARGMAITPSGNQVWVVDQNLDGLSLIDPATNTVVVRIPVGVQPLYVALGPPVSPTVTIDQAVGQADPALATPINFTVTFSEAVTGFSAADVSFTGSTAPGALAAVVTGGPTIYNVAVSGMTGSGTVVASIPAGGATGTGGGLSLASTSTDNVVAFVVVNNVFTGPSATGSGTITASFTGGGVTCTYGVRQYIGAPPGALPIPPTVPAGYTFPHGLFDFTTTACTPGSTLTFTITYPAVLPAGTVYWKYGPTTSNPAPHWYTIPAAVAGNTITFSITDGGLGDDDLTANGTIVDQGGPGVPGAPGTATAVPTLSEWMLMVLAGLMLTAAMRRRGRTPRMCLPRV